MSIYKASRSVTICIFKRGPAHLPFKTLPFSLILFPIFFVSFSDVNVFISLQCSLSLSLFEMVFVFLAGIGYTVGGDEEPY